MTHRECVAWVLGRVQGAVQRVQHFMDKAASIYERGVNSTGHGLTNSIKACHAHVNNDQALGLKWVDGNLHIVGIGEKSDAARR